MAEETEKGEKKVESKIMKDLKKNPWIAATFVFAIVALILLFVAFKGGVGGSSISESAIGSKAVSFINNDLLQGQGDVALDSVETEGGLYKVNVVYNGNKIPAYFTKDGGYFVGTQIVAISATADSGDSSSDTSTKEVPKSDKPVVKAFIFSYCPYGLQFEKALLPVYDLLKNKADINIVAIGAMHGEFEHVESLRQISIEQLYGKDKLFAYLKEFDTSSDIGACNGDATCLNKYLPAVYSKLGIDKAKVESYMSASAEAIYAQQGSEANSLGVSGSPTFVINGVESQVARTPAAIEKAICDAFNTAPSECSTVLSSTAAGAGFGGTASSSSSSSAACATP